jgi:hypothetical protein
VQFNLAIKQAHSSERLRAGDPALVQATLFLSGIEKTRSRWPALRWGVGPERTEKAGVAFGAERLGVPSVRHALLRDRKLGCRPNVDEIPGLIAAAGSAGPIPGWQKSRTAQRFIENTQNSPDNNWLTNTQYFK